MATLRAAAMHSPAMAAREGLRFGAGVGGTQVQQWAVAPAGRRHAGSSSSSRRRLAVSAKVREIFMPALSSTMTEGKIVSWSKSEGDRLSKGESVVVVESDKADMDVETFYDGILAAILVNEGEVAPVGAPIGLLAESEDEIEAAKAKAASAVSSSPAPPVAAEPAPPPPPPPPPAAAAAPPPPAAATPAPPPAPATPGKVVASPHAQKLAKQLKVNLVSIVGSGPYGRITPEDVEKAAGKAPTPSGPAFLSGALPSIAASHAAAAAAPATPAAAAAAAKPAVPAPTGTVPFNAMQNAVARNMVASLAVPVIHIGYTITTDELDALYKKLKPKGVTMTVLLVKAVALALAKHPVMNAACHDGKSFTYNSSVNVAVAVAIDGGGLITPVLQDADKVDVFTLSARWRELVGKARKKQLSPSEYATGTFTLSNLGMFGVDRFDAVVQQGQGAIMAVGGTAKTMVATDSGEFGIKSQMQVNVTADHRIIYGADVAEFLQTLAAIIENPAELTL